MTDEHWAYLTVGVYWLLGICWAVIVFSYAREYRNLRKLSPLLSVLILVIWMDGARTLLESLYFGISYTARTPLLPHRIHEVLADPQFVIYPKLLALAVAACILMVMRQGWFPNVTKELERQRETERMYAELREAQAAREVLTRMLVHDMRTPLTNLLTGLRTAKAMDDPDTERELVEVAMRGGERLLSMVNELLDLERMESGQMPVSCRSVTVSGLVAEAVYEVARLAEERGVKLEVKVEDEPEPLQISADPDLTRRVLVNLLGNALRFTPCGRRVAVTARRLGPDRERVELAVEDEGPGIPPEHQQRIFEAFYQVDREGARLGNTGLGLAFCKLAVEAQGGAIGVESTPGHGSRFWFRLPAEEHTHVPVAAGAHSGSG